MVDNFLVYVKKARQKKYRHETSQSDPRFDDDLEK